MRKYIVVTGATGFVGSAVVRLAVKNGDHPIILKRPSSSLYRIKDIKGLRCFTYGTLLEKSLIREIKKYNPIAFIHLAWSGVSGRGGDAPYQLTDNLPLTVDSVKFAKEVGCSQWVGIGSQAEYGIHNRKINESFPTAPTSLYGKAKLACCWTALGLCQSYGIVGSWIRLFALYGPNDNRDWLIPYIIREMMDGKAPNLTKCEQMWDYLYIDDATEAIMGIVYKKAPGIYNLGSGKAAPLKNIIEIIRKLVKSKVKPHYGVIDYKPDQIMYLRADIRKIRDTVGWSPRIGIQRGMAQTVKWYQSPSVVIK